MLIVLITSKGPLPMVRASCPWLKWKPLLILRYLLTAVFNFLRFENGVILWCIWLSFFQKIQRIPVNDNLLSIPKKNMTEIRQMQESETVLYVEVFCSYHKWQFLHPSPTNHAYCLLLLPTFASSMSQIQIHQMPSQNVLLCVFWCLYCWAIGYNGPNVFEHSTRQLDEWEVFLSAPSLSPYQHRILLPLYQSKSNTIGQ